MRKPSFATSELKKKFIFFAKRLRDVQRAAILSPVSRPVERERHNEQRGEARRVAGPPPAVSSKTDLGGKGFQALQLRDHSAAIHQGRHYAAAAMAGGIEQDLGRAVDIRDRNIVRQLKGGAPGVHARSAEQSAEIQSVAGAGSEAQDLVCALRGSIRGRSWRRRRTEWSRPPSRH